MNKKQSSFPVVKQVSNRALCREQQNKFSIGSDFQWGLNLGPHVTHSDIFLTKLTWQILIKGCLTLLLFGTPIDFWI